MKQIKPKIYFIIVLLFSYSFSNSEFLNKKNDFFDTPEIILERYKKRDSKLYESEPPMLKNQKKSKSKKRDFDIGYDIDIDRQTGELQKYYFDIKKNF
ncbi:MAG: hypothetical protein ACQERD_07090 [Campylobacterota bacterium]